MHRDRPALALALTLTLIGLASACDDAPAAGTSDVPDAAGDASSNGDPSAPTDTSPGVSGPRDVAAEVRGLEGAWAMLVVQAAIAELPVVGETRAVTRTLLLSELEATGDGTWRARESICTIDLDSGTELVRTIMPDAAVAAMTPTEREVSGDESTGAVSGARVIAVWGATLDDVVTEALPTEPDDPRVVDHEGDGRPGMTVRITGLLDGEVYVVQRGWTTLEGAVVGPDRVTGRVSWGEEQAILGADNPILESPVPSRPDPDPAASHFRMTRLPPGSGCSEVMAAGSELAL